MFCRPDYCILQGKKSKYYKNLDAQQKKEDEQFQKDTIKVNKGISKLQAKARGSQVKVEMKPELSNEEKAESEESQLDPRSRQCPYLDTINRYFDI